MQGVFVPSNGNGSDYGLTKVARKSSELRKKHATRDRKLYNTVIHVKNQYTGDWKHDERYDE